MVDSHTANYLRRATFFELESRLDGVRSQLEVKPMSRATDTARVVRRNVGSDTARRPLGNVRSCRQP
jgi:hypothetical protein